MTLKVKKIEFHNFRGFRDLVIDGLGRVNLITGRNNVGKSSLLEGMRILAYGAVPEVVSEILRRREEDVDLVSEERGGEFDSLFQALALFHGFPQLSDFSEQVTIATYGEDRKMELTMRIGWFANEVFDNGHRRLVEQPPIDVFGEPFGFPALVTRLNDRQRIFRQEQFTRAQRFGPSEIDHDFIDEILRPCVYDGPHTGERTDALEDMWDNIALSEYQNYVLESLKIIDPQITAVAMIGSDGVRSRHPKPRIAMVRSENIPRRVPLRSFGDGINRLFSIILSLVNARGGLLLIDEFENGLHWTTHLDAWRTLFRHAEELDIQVFATTHSWDVIEAFQKVSAESAETGVLTRLVRRNEKIIPTVFSEDELKIITKGKIEVR